MPAPNCLCDGSLRQIEYHQFCNCCHIDLDIPWGMCLNGVGVDGGGRIFPFFTFLGFFFVFLRFSSLFSHSARGQGRTTAIYCKNGECHSDPVCTDPVRDFPNTLGCALHNRALESRYSGGQKQHAIFFGCYTTYWFSAKLCNALHVWYFSYDP